MTIRSLPRAAGLKPTPTPASKARAADEDGAILLRRTHAAVLTVAVALEGKDAVSAAFATVLRGSLLNLDHLLEALQS